MSEDAAQHEPWALRLPGDEAVRRPGESLKEWAGDDRGRARRLLDRATLRELNDPKLAGAWGEERVGKELAKLDGAWTVLHGIKIGPRADLDHLVVGPAGVFSLNTKHLDFDAKVVVSARQFRVNGYSRDYYPKAVKEARRVADRLAAAVGFPVVVRPVLVITGVDRRNVRLKEQPGDVTVLLRRRLRAWLQGLRPALARSTVSSLAAKARHPSTWDPSKVAEVLDVVPPPAPEVPATITVTPWRRYGHDRLYVNDEATGRRLGWRNNKTGDVIVEEAADPALVAAALRRWDADD
jgi:hypothetical protein